MLVALWVFIGTPDWRSAVLAVLFALPWLVVLCRGWLRSRWLWVAVVLAAVLFAPTIAWLQVPLQHILSGVWRRLLAPETIRQYLLLVGIPSLVVASVVQEAAKLLIAVLALRGLGARRVSLAGLVLGAAAGAGYGGFEAFWVFNTVFAYGWSWAMVQLSGPMALLPFIERLLVVAFHIALTALAGYGYAVGRPWRYLLLAVGLHTLCNYSVLLAQAGVVDIIGAELWVATVVVATVGSAVWVRQGLTARASREVSSNGD